MTASLCQSCAHCRTIVSGTGAQFLLCERSLREPGYPKYPPQPVVRCAGHESRSPPDSDAG